MEKSIGQIFLKNLLLPSDFHYFKDFEELFYKFKSNEKSNFKDENSGKNEIKKKTKKYEDDMSFLIYSNILSTYLVETINTNEKVLNQQNFWNNLLDKLYKSDKKTKSIKNTF